MDEQYLVDIWRTKNRYKRQYTWSQMSPQVACRLDMWLIPSDLAQIVETAEIVPAIATDHSAITVRIRSGEQILRGPGFWKLNTTVLKEKQYQDMIIKVIQDLENDFKTRDVDPRYQWEEIKFWVRSKSIEYCKKRASKRRSREKEVYKRLQKLEETLHELGDDVVEEYGILKKEFEELFDEKVKGNILRSRARWIAQGERNTKYFYGLEKRNSAHQSITQLEIQKNGKSTLIDSPGQIQEEIHEFYSNLYSSKQKQGPNLGEEYDEFFENHPQISQEESDNLGKAITMEECELAMNQMADGKSPGEDGLPVEFYKTFWKQLRNTLFKAYKCSLEEGVLSSSMTRGVIRLLPKPLKNLLSLKNWRPITLLTVDYKILSKVLANRLKKILPKIINEDQAGFMQGRYIGENIRGLWDLIDNISEEEETGLLISLDIEKAFDTVELPFLFNAMAALGIGEEFQRMIEVLYTNAHSSVLNYGYTTQRFPLMRGVRQGDPLSPYLFIIAIEILATAIRRNKDIKGIQVNGRTYKLLQYADDTIVLTKDKFSIRLLLALLEIFEECSGLKTNADKTEIIGLGKWKELREIYAGISISPDPKKILGLWFCHDKKKMRDMNVGGKLERIKFTLGSWFNRGLTLQGKIMVLKTLGLSQLTYPMINLYVPKYILTQIDKFVFEYIWGSPKKVKIKRKVLIQDYGAGGMKAPDIYSMDKIWKLGWITRLQNDISGNWKQLLFDKLDSVGGLDYLLVSNFEVGKLPLNLSDFWKTVFQAYAEVTPNVIITKEDIKTQLINNNKHITIGGKSIFMKMLIDTEMDEIQNWFNFEGTARSFREIKARVPNLRWMQYFQIMSAIPQEWKRMMKHRTRFGIDVSSPRPVFDIKTAKIMLKTQQQVEPTALRKWNVQHRDDANFWWEMFTLARKNTTESKLQVFQYKVIHRVIASREMLFKVKIVENPYCPDCHSQVETLEHLLLDCPRVKEIWEKLAQTFEYNEKRKVDLTTETVILGQCSRSRKIRNWNYLALLTKFYIYRCRLNHRRPNWISFKPFAQYKLGMKLWIAKQEQNEKELEQWSNWRIFATQKNRTRNQAL